MYITPAKPTLKPRQQPTPHQSPYSYTNHPYIPHPIQPQPHKPNPYLHHHQHHKSPKPTQSTTSTPTPTPTLLTNSTIRTSTQTKNIDAVEIDYKEKAFQFMRKNIELEINMKQARNDIRNLEMEVQKFSGIVGEILGTVGVGGLGDLGLARDLYETKNNNQDPTLPQQLIPQTVKHNQSTTTSTQKPTPQTPQPKTLHTESIYLHPQPKLQPTSRTNLRSQKPPNQTSSHLHLQLHELADTNQNINSQINSNCNQATCQCEEHYSIIINQYKNIIENQHSNIMKKEKSNKMLRKEVEEFRNINQELRLGIGRYEGQVAELEKKIAQLDKANKQYQQNIRNMKQTQQKSQQRIKQLQSMLDESQKIIEQKCKEIDQISKQKQKARLKYKQQISQFEEMEKLVEKQLIRVEYEMNYYKKERKENFQKIRRIQAELKEYKSAEEKKYYSFGDHHKDCAIQVQQRELMRNQANLTVSEDRKVSIKSNKRQGQSHYDEDAQDDVPELKEVQTNKIYKDKWQIQCYEQSIKTLLIENNRLKQSLLKLYKKGAVKPDQIDESISVQLKMLLSTIREQTTQEDKEQGQENEQKQAKIIENVKKGRRFIKEV